MKLGHFHAGVRSLNDAIAWFEQVLQLSPSFAQENMASYSLGGITLIIDAAAHDSELTLGFESSNCDSDYERLIARGAQGTSPPTDYPWGVRAAYLRGPGGISIELEQDRSS
jgi:uncharacterized glyoxalase superfamily protein PhnB